MLIRSTIRIAVKKARRGLAIDVENQRSRPLMTGNNKVNVTFTERDKRDGVVVGVYGKGILPCNDHVPYVVGDANDPGCGVLLPYPDHRGSKVACKWKVLSSPATTLVITIEWKAP